LIKLSGRKLALAIKQGQIKAARSLALSIPEMIRERVLSGVGLAGTFKALSKSYVAFRKRVGRELSSDTSPQTSNLTATGQMLKAMVGEAAGTIIRITIKGKRTSELSGEPKLTNNQVRKYVEEDRPFFGLTRKERTIIEQNAAEIIKQEIRRALK
jgi:hypothetical protein